MESVKMTIEFRWNGQDIEVVSVSSNRGGVERIVLKELKTPPEVTRVPLSASNPSLIIFHHGSPGYVTYMVNGVLYRVKVPQ